MVFPTSNLPTAALPWGREVEKQLSAATITIKSNELNNAARDNQLAASLTRVNAAVLKAQEAIDAIGNLDQATSTYKINASNLTAGTLNASIVNVTNLSASSITTGSFSGDRITGGTITGATLETASSGRRVKISGTTATFYDESSNYSGTITVSGYANEAVMQINGPFASRSISFSAGNTYISGGGGTYINLSDEPRITLGGNVTIAGNTTLSGITVATANMRVDGTSFSLPNITDSTAAANTRWGTTTSGRLFYISSARRAKYDIQDAAVGLEALNLRPRTWFDMNEYIENGNSTEGLVRIPGFVAEEVLEAGLEEFVTYNSDGLIQGLSYDRMVAAVIPVIKYLNDQVEQLKTEIESLKGA